MNSTPEGTRRSRTRWTLPLALGLLIGVTVWQSWTRRGSSPFEFTDGAMGTSYTIKVDEPLTTRRQQAVSDLIRTRITEVDRIMSTYDSTSELSRFNRLASLEPFAVDSLLAYVVELALGVTNASAGAFDVTVAPLVDAWGFGPPGQALRVPTPEELDALRRRVGPERVRVDTRGATLTKTHPNAVVDLSAIAKGFAVDRVAEGLRDMGITHFLVEIGGELRASGGHRNGAAWQIGIERPDPAHRGVFRTVEVTDGGFATSGDYRNAYELEGVRYAHIIDPRTGTPIRYRGTSVSVFLPNTAVADAWATALTVLGADDGIRVAERNGIAALFVERDGTGLSSRATVAFERRFGPDPDSPPAR
jgi:thiamine biosynthesis lipoprotein